MAASTVLLSEGRRGRAPSPYTTVRRRRFVADLVGVSPTMALYGVFIVVPVIFALVLSFTNWNVVGALKWVGFANWSTFLSDPVAHHSLLVTFELAALSWAVQTPLAMALGIFIAGTQRYRSFYAAIYLLPLLLSTAGLALMWQDVLIPDFGGVAWLGVHLHMAFLNQNWLGSPRLALFVIVAIITWQFVPFHTLIYQAGRRAVPVELYDAATVDGASVVQAFRHVTLPQMRYTIVTSSTLIVVGSLTYFDIIYILTLGGPGDTTRVLAMDMYNVGFMQTEFGYASVLATVLGVIGITVALLLVKLTGFSSMQGAQEGIW
ncbi:MAG TPA: sugar ABC transporter permease, partial [Acidimicrobiales bacterium]|nr:sugar ABC transporter permease [Acidimicrobiales bacterium]